MSSNNFNFIPFTDVGSKLSNYAISINKNGGFGFNSGFYKKEKINNFSHVSIFYDKDKKLVAFSFTNDGTKTGTFKITKNRNSASVVARSFFTSLSNLFDCNLDKYCGRHIPKVHNDDSFGKLYYIELKEKESE